MHFSPSTTYTSKDLTGELGGGKDTTVALFRHMADQLIVKGAKAGNGVAEAAEVAAFIKKYDKNGDGKLTVTKAYEREPVEGQPKPRVITKIE